ncbi:MAG: PTS sugar transporter subunit IIC, partial [Erysipelothrix sp.]|nr:PTS sugar transporter subunit IIC [Erysipelothrix sp.]
MAFIDALFVSTIYVKFQTNGWVIKMPNGVPPIVTKSFSSLVPSFVIMFIMLAVRFIFMQTVMGDVHTMIFSFIAKPLTALGTSFPVLFVAILAMQVLWLFGIHGGMIIYTVFIGIWMPLG